MLMAKVANIKDPNHPHYLKDASGAKIDKDTIQSDPDAAKGLQLMGSGHLSFEITKEHATTVNPDGSAETRFEGVRHYNPNP